MRALRITAVALTLATVGVGGFAAWRVVRARRATATSTPTATATATPSTSTPSTSTEHATEHSSESAPAPGSAAAREAALLEALDHPAAQPALPPLPPLVMRPVATDRLTPQERARADAAAEVEAAFDQKGRAAPIWPPLREGDPPPGPRLTAAQHAAQRVARARPRPPVVVPERLDAWGE